MPFFVAPFLLINPFFLKLEISRSMVLCANFNVNESDFAVCLGLISMAFRMTS